MKRGESEERRPPLPSSVGEAPTPTPSPSEGRGRARSRARAGSMGEGIEGSREQGIESERTTGKMPVPPGRREGEDSEW
jgi:hypothetical protein